jgi:uncharacterized protein (TIGR03437 family)
MASAQTGIAFTQLTSASSRDWFPVWRPDGTKILFSSNRTNLDRANDIWDMNPDGSQQRQLVTVDITTPSSWGDPGLSPYVKEFIGSTGDLAVIKELDYWEVMRVALSSATSFPIVRTVWNGPDTFFSDLLFVPGGLGTCSFAYSDATQNAAWINCDGGQQQVRIAPFSQLSGQSSEAMGTVLLTTSPDGVQGGLAFAPNGQQPVASLCITSCSALSRGTDLYVLDAATGQVVQRLTTDGDTGISALQPRWSPDGQWITFVSNKSGNNEIWMIHPDGTGVSQVTANGLDNSGPSWSPDSTSLVFATNNSGSYSIWLATVPKLAIRPSQGVLNAASYTASIAPGSIAAAFGSFLLSSPSQPTGLPLPTSFGGLSMQFGSGTKAPLFYVSGSQVNFQVPWELAGQSQVPVTVTVNGQTSAPQTATIAPFSPGVFAVNGQGTGQGAILDASNHLVDASNPATAGSTVLQIFCTGLGAVTNQPPSGSPAPTNTLAKTTTTPTVTIGGASAQVQFSGLVPGYVGEYQVNALVPATAATGNAVPMTISIGGVTSNTVTIAVQSGPGSSTESIASVNPASSFAGEMVSESILGANTSFVQGQTLASFGPGVSVGGAPEGQPGPLIVTAATRATAQLVIDPAASAGARTVTVTTGTQTLTLNNGFSVLAPPAALGPLSVVSSSPANGATGVSPATAIKIAFNGPLDQSTVSPATFTFANGSNVLPVTVAYDSTNQLVTLSPAGLLRPQTTYTVTVSPLVRNLAENPLGTPYAFSFTTILPASVSGAVTPPAGLDPSTLSVVSFGGTLTSPSSSGTFSASLNPVGTGLVAAMLPGKSFGLLALTIAGSPSGSDGSQSENPRTVASSPAIRVRTTRWQVTASSVTANAAGGIVADLQTTAEALVFMSPYLLTADPQRAPAIMTAIAGNPATAQLAQVLAQSWSEAAPLNDPAVQSARQNAIQAVAQELIQVPAAQQGPEQQRSFLRNVLHASSVAGDTSALWSPPTVAVTPYCWPNLNTSVGWLPCLDLDYISFPSGTVTVDQASGNYAFGPNNCTNSILLLGCAVGWLGRVTPIPGSSDGSNPASITAGGPDSFGPESPVGGYDSAPCGSSTPCAAVWIDGSSGLQYLDLESDFVQAVSVVVQHFTQAAAAGPAFSLPASSQQETDYMVRFYSGGIADSNELANVIGSQYAGGQTLFSEALGLNALESVFNGIDALKILPDGVTSCALEGSTQLLIQSIVATSVAPTQDEIESEFETVAGGAISQAASCFEQNALDNTMSMVGDLFSWGTGVGTVLNGLSAAGSLGEAVQRVTELETAASAVETAVIAINPGSAVAANPIPSISTLSPSSVAAGTGPLTLTINGSGFINSSTVTFNGASRAPVFVNSGLLTVALGAADVAVAGTFAVVVTNPQSSGGSSSSLPATFTVTSPTPNPQPNITGLTPPSATAGSGPLTLTINGSGFIASSTVTFNAVSHAATLVNSGQLTITLAASDLDATGSFAVVVSNPAPGGGVSNAFTFAVQPAVAPPTLTKLTLSASSVVAGGSVTGTVTLNGAAPAGGVQITIQDSPAILQVGSSVTVPAEQTTATFTISAPSVTSPTTVTITATLASVTVSASLVVNPAATANPFQNSSFDIYGTLNISEQAVPLAAIRPAAS